MRICVIHIRLSAAGDREQVQEQEQKQEQQAG